jgi:hypothetical protein
MKQLSLAVLFFPLTVFAGLDDFFELDEEMVVELNNEIGVKSDMYWAHLDFDTEESAPIIRLKILRAETDPRMVGSYSTLRQALRGKSTSYQTLQLQAWLLSQQSPELVLAVRVTNYDFDDDLSILILGSEYLDSEDTVWEQFQLLQWADDENSKCIIVSDIESRVSAYYSETVIDAMVEIVEWCSVGLNAATDPQNSGT